MSKLLQKLSLFRKPSIQDQEFQNILALMASTTIQHRDFFTSNMGEIVSRFIINNGNYNIYVDHIFEPARQMMYYRISNHGRPIYIAQQTDDVGSSKLAQMVYTHILKTWQEQNLKHAR